MKNNISMQDFYEKYNKKFCILPSFADFAGVFARS